MQALLRAGAQTGAREGLAARQRAHLGTMMLQQARQPAMAPSAGPALPGGKTAARAGLDRCLGPHLALHSSQPASCGVDGTGMTTHCC